MASTIRTLFTNLAGLSIVYVNTRGTTLTIEGRDLNKLPPNIVTANLPTRILMPTESWGSEGSSLERISVGTASPGALMTWNVTDLYLHEAVGQDRGLQVLLPDLVLYCGAYVDTMLTSAAGAFAAGMSLSGLNVAAGIYEYPLGSGTSFFGVECTSTWIELLN
jgi:hypothetical protein